MAPPLWNIPLLCLVLWACVQPSLPWSGNVCEQRKCVYVTKRVCSYSTWLGCCAYKTIRVPQIRVDKFCCSGWKHSGNQRCTVPVCEPNCMNGGTCTKPGLCSCLKQFAGPRCGSSQCSHVDPCYPGACEPGSTQCKCTEGFSDSGRGRSEHCLKIENKPELFQLQANMSYWGSMNNKYMEVYSLLADASGKSDADFIWSNRKKFNKLIISASTQFSANDLPPPPSYVSDSGLGIVTAEARVELTKTRLPAGRRRKRQGDRYISQNQTMVCDNSPSPRRPSTTLFLCSLESRFDRQLDTGDILTISFFTKNGGFRKLKDLNTGRVVSTQEFEGRPFESRVEFRFDHEPPYHCSETRDCTRGEKPLSVQDLTKDPLEIEWGGWQDGLSGMFRYTLEVFPLNQTLNRLEILKPLEPIYSLPLSHAGLSTPVQYRPPGVGMYALILESADLANNTRFVRRLVLYDPDSKVTADPLNPLVFSSASPAANYTYQNSTRREIVVRWEGTFRNAVHEDLGLLGKVQRYPPQLEENLKTIPEESDDQEGPRTVAAIANRRGIVNFDLAYEKYSRVGEGEERLRHPPPSVSWITKGLSLTHTVSESVSDGDTIFAWVRATDVMGNQLVRRTEVTFDETTPDVGQFLFNMNRVVPGIPFSSTFVLDAKDMQSGVAYIQWTFTRSNGTVIYSQRTLGKRAGNCRTEDFKTCYCTPRGQCYLLDQSYSLSNCHMMVEKENLATEVISVKADIVNAAGLVTSRTMEKGQLTMLNGTEAYFPPQNVHVLSLRETSVTLTWDFPPSCYERTDLWVVVPDSRGQGVMRPVHKDAERYDVSDLEPGKDYSIQLIARYAGQVKSDPTLFSFRTPEQAGLTAGATGGVVAGVLLLLLLLLLVVALVVIVRRRGTPRFLQGERMQNLRNSVRRFRSRSSAGNVHHDHGVSMVKQVEEPEDLYLAATQTWEERRPWQMDPNSLVLQDQIASGKFADIYRATWTAPGADGKRTTVAAKILKPEFSTDDANKLMKKIEFFASVVGTHDNVLLFHGAILDNQPLGPVMILEYCETGQLDTWLTAGQGKVSEDTIDKLFRFAADIARGMDYLASKKIVHSRLAARNVLLTFLLDVKIAGFGPPGVSGGKVAAKWASPEVLEERPATEKSDVWAYGVTLWEIFSMGNSPYPDVRGTEMGPYLKSGKRMEKPEFADDRFYKLMQSCWKEKPNSRPSFAQIKQQLCALFTPKARNSGDFYYEANQLRK